MRVKAQLVQVTAKKLVLSTKLGAAVAEFEMSSEKLVVVRGTRDLLMRLGKSIVGQSVRALDVFVNQAGTQLVDRPRSGLEPRMLVVIWSFQICRFIRLVLGKLVFKCRVPLLLVPRVAVLLIRICPRLFLRSSPLLSLKDPVVVPRRLADDIVFSIWGLSLAVVKAFSLSVSLFCCFLRRVSLGIVLHVGA